jgi:predicted transcriptional regulator of viral defense system
MHSFQQTNLIRHANQILTCREAEKTRRRDPLYDKARKLAESGRIEFLGNGVYNVVGDHGTYIVAETPAGQLSCNCPGFLQKGRCSHALAVMLLAKRKHRSRG